MAETSIEWCDYTLNPVEGCQRVSPGCTNCYAERKNKWLRKGQNWGPGTRRLGRSEAYWKQPLRWNAEAQAAGERRKVFVASVADVFEDHPDWLAPRLRLFRLIEETPQLDWLLLTKRPENILRLWPDGVPPPGPYSDTGGWPNIWLGTTVEDQQRADERIPHLLAVPAAVRFLSCEPLLERVDLGLDQWPVERPTDPRIDWVIVGGESGPSARPFDVEWARGLRDQCAAAGTAFFMKQLGARTRLRPAEVGGDADLPPMVFPMRKSEAADLATMPEDLRIREFPGARHG